MKQFFLVFCFFSVYIFPQDDLLTFSEIMFYPQAANSEFIEIFNLTDNPIDLKDFKIKYHTSSVDGFAETGSGFILLPNSNAVILEGDYSLDSGIYKSLIPEEALILKLDNSAFGSSGMANTTSRVVYLLNAQNEIVDSCLYSADNKTGYSDEKIIITSDNSSSNWNNSKNANGTPGFKNSVSLKENDLAFGSVKILPELIFPGQKIQINVSIRNEGLAAAENYNLELYLDTNLDSLTTDDEIIFSNQYSYLLPNDSQAVQIQIDSLTAGTYNIIAVIKFEADEDISNNHFYTIIEVRSLPNMFNDVVINEFMYTPLQGEAEWIEIYNRTNKEINLKKWKLSDNSTSVSISLKDIYIPARSFVILSKDSTVAKKYDCQAALILFNVPSLNNSGDIICIKDTLGITIDSLEYLPDWGGNSGKSLERISTEAASVSKDNWGTSKNLYKGTPGKVNSLTQKNYDLELANLKIIEKFGIVSGTVTLELKIKNPGRNDAENFMLNIYSDLNADSVLQESELLKNQAFSKLPANDSSVITYSFAQILQGKNYLAAEIVFTADEDLTNNSSFINFNGVFLNEMRSDIVINEIMYAPLSNEPEWIEIYNRSSKTINLKNYQLADNSDTTTIVNSLFNFSPGEYAVIAKDSSISNSYNISSKLIISSFPSLNNTSDKVILIDSLNRTIDSISYSSKWGGTNGKSLERIDVNFSATDSTNWKTCESRLRATPGSINSVTQKNYDIEAAGIYFHPQFPVKNDDVTISVMIKNTGKENAAFHLNLFEDTDLDSLAEKFVLSSSQITLASGDSVLYNFDYLIKNLSKEKAFKVEGIFEQDQDTSNNSAYKIIKPGFLPKSILINEIMYLPQNGEPEWVELYNVSDDTINIKGWKISDIFTTPVNSIIAKKDYTLLPKSYLVLSKDSTVLQHHRFIPSEIIKTNIPVLNNDEDGVVIKDGNGITIDSVKYSKSWESKTGFSIERISFTSPSEEQANWKASTDIEQSTPGRINSAAIKMNDLSLVKVSSIPEYPVTGESIKISARITNNGNNSTNDFSVKFYNRENENVYSILLDEINWTNLICGDTVEISSNQSIQIDSTICLSAEIIFENDEDIYNNFREEEISTGYKKNILVINEVMYNPNDKEPEWIEFVNASSEPINLKNWKIGSSSSNMKTLTLFDFILNPDEYLVVSKDSTFFNYYSTDSEFAILNFGTLGNNTGQIIVKDFRDAEIDSLIYKSIWGAKKGFSLERISSSKPTNDSTNWVSSLCIDGSTPGSENSCVNLASFETGTLIINEIMFEPANGYCEFIEFYNTGNDSINIGGWKITDASGNTTKLSDINYFLSGRSFYVLSADSTLLNNFPYLQNSYYNISNTDLSLGNSEDKIILKDATNVIIDSVFYNNSWHNKNFISAKNHSLERINPDLNSNAASNWSTSVHSSGATPGKENSISIRNEQSEKTISITPNPFSPDNDGFEDFCIINYSLREIISQVDIKIFDSQGRLIRKLQSNQPSGAKGSVIFDGLDDSGNPLRMGIYIVLLEAFNNTNGFSEAIKTVVVVARKLN